ncbi:uncharacterized protein LOC113356986 [Papaver somniferum]|uniref:uncharacterized protein LOC113356986 n=1 Tax=Papaver somniferum TaxID=3469 RepID=UPI000E6FD316|nr:uncharacterized protein LOC113356986 [Papaver somniferum]
MAPERKAKVAEEIDRMLEARIIRPVKYPEWIVELVDATSGFERLAFMDGYSGYNQIPLYEEDQEHTAFITDKGIYCYLVMPFGLKNAGATYQRLVDEMFKDMIGKTMEVYIDDMVVKSKKKESHLMDLKRTFDRLRQYGMKLNPSKCSFGLTSGKFLGYMMTQRGIEANPEQIRAILEMPSPRNKKEIQRLTGRLAALNRFISRFSDKCKSFFLALKKAEKFGWNEECEHAFNEIKQYLISPPVLTSPKTGQTVYIYLAASDYAVSAVFKAFKAILRRTRLVVYTEYPLKKVLGRTDDSSRLATWATYLGAYTIDYEPRTAEKGHAIASLMADFPVDDIPVSESILEEEILHDTESILPIPLPWERINVYKKSSKATGVQMGNKDSMMTPKGDSGMWNIYTDGSQIPTGQAVRLGFTASNNQAEYEAVISGLKTAIHLGARKVKLITDSRLVANHYSGTYKARNERLASYLEYIHELAKEFELFEIEQKPRLENRHADALAYVSAAVVSDTTRYIVVEFQELPSTHSTIDAARKVYAGENNSSSLEIPEDSMDTDEVDNIQPKDWSTIHSFPANARASTG